MEQEEMVDIYMNHFESGQQREAVSCFTVSPTLARRLCARAFHRRGRLGRAAFLDRVTTATAPLSSRGGGAI
ncbi:hypothetical protein EYF80_043509 [Liparis tanakae]|uniref:Uncharacterized protein n=1 Tax=Liparis tanakae TaxID=230148 RepID=A0A4Z2FZ61_9TELE|nr:hypothetical protein EYF80_043509 [Liparis tanakae]